MSTYEFILLLVKWRRPGFDKFGSRFLGSGPASDVALDSKDEKGDLEDAAVVSDGVRVEGREVALRSALSIRETKQRRRKRTITSNRRM